MQCECSYHLAEKKIPSIHGYTMGYKLEQFIFDAFPYAPSMTLFEVICLFFSLKPCIVFSALAHSVLGSMIKSYYSFIHRYCVKKNLLQLKMPMGRIMTLRIVLACFVSVSTLVGWLLQEVS